MFYFFILKLIFIVKSWNFIDKKEKLFIVFHKCGISNL